MLGGRLRRRRVDRLGAQRAGVVPGHPLPRRRFLDGAGRRPQRGHQLQAGDGGGPTRSDDPLGVDGEHAGEFGRLEIGDAGPGPLAVTGGSTTTWSRPNSRVEVVTGPASACAWGPTESRGSRGFDTHPGPTRERIRRGTYDDGPRPAPASCRPDTRTLRACASF
jgi:hypothetical protein